MGGGPGAGQSWTPGAVAGEQRAPSSLPSPCGWFSHGHWDPLLCPPRLRVGGGELCTARDAADTGRASLPPRRLEEERPCSWAPGLAVVSPGGSPLAVPGCSRLNGWRSTERMKRAEQIALEGGCDRLGETNRCFKGKPQGGSNSFPGGVCEGRCGLVCPAGPSCALVCTGLSGAQEAGPACRCLLGSGRWPSAQGR